MSILLWTRQEHVFDIPVIENEIAFYDKAFEIIVRLLFSFFDKNLNKI